MKKSTGFLLGFISAIGVVSYMVSEVIKNDSFSDETKDNYNTFIKDAKRVGSDLKRTYTAIGDKDEFLNMTSSLQNNAKKLAKNTGNLLKEGASNVIDYYKEKINEKASKYIDEDEEETPKKKVVEKKQKKILSKKPIKKSNKK